jgi:hypothetical protein
MYLFAIVMHSQDEYNGNVGNQDFIVGKPGNGVIENQG